ncbi:hypothetical protein KIS4809_4995 [Bacillus sp. ZZV12-4809]|nr:hypothetical protein KIS4809_4995 [Bacillus sp. ZZV12-4809]
MQTRFFTAEQHNKEKSREFMDNLRKNVHITRMGGNPLRKRI